ncbi:hypothetical protein [Variovorax sp. PvP013]|uniref:hypothetical protein n=1 Tax=Variovorax sp. PvP013 TaxID=3156435 RepID=UPI003D2390A1
MVAAGGSSEVRSTGPRRVRDVGPRRGAARRGAARRGVAIISATTPLTVSFASREPCIAESDPSPVTGRSPVRASCSWTESDSVCIATSQRQTST